jgi:hypothetical protein
VLEFVEVLQPAHAAAQVAGLGAQQAVTLDMQNVAAVALDVASMPVDPSADLLVQAGYGFLQVKAPLPARLHLVRDGDQWAAVDGWTPAPSPVRRYLPGAAANLYYAREPMMIVFGTQGPAERVKLLSDAARQLSAWPGAGRDMFVGRFPVREDKQVTAQDIERFNLILIGGPRDSELAARIATKLPLRISDTNELIIVGRDEVSLDGAGVRLFHFNPLAPGRLLFWIAPSDRPGDADAAAKWLKDPRRLVTGSRGSLRGCQPDLVVQGMADDSMRRSMQLTRQWQWRAVDGAGQAAPPEFASARQFTQARLRAMRKATGADLAMDWGSDAAAAVYDPRWATRADLAVWTTPSQTLLGSVTGQELMDIHTRWLEKHDIEVFPAVDPAQVDPHRTYRIALTPSLCFRLSGREKNLVDPAAGPDIAAQEVVAEVFGR